jgi:hypothetical protein
MSPYSKELGVRRLKALSGNDPWGKVVTLPISKKGNAR